MDGLCCIRVFILSATILCYTSLNCQYHVADSVDSRPDCSSMRSDFDMYYSQKVFGYQWDVFRKEARGLIACPKRNMYIKVLENGKEKCETCPPCDIGTQKKRCSLWHGIECEPCPSGLFNDKYGKKCKPCTVCKPGYYAKESCSPTNDTVCFPCPQGTYSPVEDSPSCFPCTPCKRHEELLGNCLTTRNTVCGDCMEGYFRESATESCWPCAKCHNDTFVVTECYLKSGGSSNKVCMPTNGMRSTRVLEGNLENEIIGNTTNDRNMESFTMVFTGVLVVTVFSVSLISVVYLVIVSSRRTQRLLGESQAVGKYEKEKKIRIESNYHDRETKNKMYRRLKKSWKSLSRIFNYKERYKSKCDVSSQNRSVRDSKIMDSRLSISYKSTILDTGDVIDDEKLSTEQETTQVRQSSILDSAIDFSTLTLTDTDEKLETSECCFTELDKRYDQSKTLGHNSHPDVRDNVDSNEMNKTNSTLYVNENAFSGLLTGSVCSDQSVESVALRPKKKSSRRKQRLTYKHSTCCILGEPKYAVLYHTV